MAHEESTKTSQRDGEGVAKSTDVATAGSNESQSGQYVPSSPYSWIREGDVVCEAIGSHCHMTVRMALAEAYHAGAAESHHALIVQRDALKAALTALMADVEAGVLVRNVANDHIPAWASQALRLVTHLSAAQTALELTEAGE